MMTVLMVVENNTISGLKQVITIKEGKTNLSPRSLSNIQSALRCYNPECTLFVYFENFAPALTNLMELLIWALIHFLDDKMFLEQLPENIKQNHDEM